MKKIKVCKFSEVQIEEKLKPVGKIDRNDIDLNPPSTIYGDELIPSTNFDTTSPWLVTNADANNTFSASGGTANLEWASSTDIYITNEDVMTVGKTYELTIQITSITVDTVGLRLHQDYLYPSNSLIGIPGTTAVTGDVQFPTTVGTHTITFLADTTPHLIIARGGVGGDVDFQILSLKEVCAVASSDKYVVEVEVDLDAQTPDDGDFIFFGKENKVNISGVRGYYAEVDMRNDSSSAAKLFSVGSEISKSSK